MVGARRGGEGDLFGLAKNGEVGLVGGVEAEELLCADGGEEGAGALVEVRHDHVPRVPGHGPHS